MIRVTSVRFFLTVSPAPGWMRVAFGAAVLMGAATLWLDPAEVDSALGTILFLQMFAASNAYASSAARGYFDPLLVSGRAMWRVAAGNFVAAALPGAISWAILVTMASALGYAAVAIAPQRQVALLIVSSAAWSAGLALPRMAGGALWAVVILTLAMSRGALADSLVMLQTPPTGFLQLLSAAAACAVCPFLLLGALPAALDLRVLALDLTAAVAVAVAGGRYVCRREHPLVEPV